MQNVLNYKTILEKIKKLVEKNKTISELKKLELYEEIYELYGQKAYLNSVPVKYRSLELEELIEAREFEEIFKKYGAKIYESYLPEMNLKENFDEYGEYRIDKEVKFRYYDLKFARYLATIGALVMLAYPTIFRPTVNGLRTFISSVVYSEKIEQYNKENEEYAKYINSLGLNDHEVIMKVMYDLWNNIDRYGDPQSEIYGYFRLNMSDEKPIGVCRHIADDVGAKLNAINPEYNARDVIVCFDSKTKMEFPSVIDELFVTKTSASRQENDGGIQAVSDSEEKNENFDFEKIRSSFSGNHMVLFVDIKDDNITLVVDPTNPVFGVYNNGQFCMFSTIVGSGYDNSLFEQYIYGLEREIDYIKIKNMSYSYNELVELYKKWGVEASNIALDHALEIADLAAKKGYTYTKK